MSLIDITLEQIQTVTLRRRSLDRATSVVSVTDAVRATGLGAGATFHFDPSSVEMLGVLLAFGEPGLERGHRARFARAVHRLSTDPETFELEIPSEGLRALDIVSHASGSEKPLPELTVWAGSQLLGFAVRE